MQDLEFTFIFLHLFQFPPFPPALLIYGCYKIIYIFLQFGMEGLYKTASICSVG